MYDSPILDVLWIGNRVAAALQYAHSFSDESGNAGVSAKKGSCEIQRDGVAIRFSDPNAGRSAPQVDIMS